MFYLANMAHTGLEQFLPLWFQIEDHPSPGSGQSGPADQQNEEHNVGQGGCHPHHLMSQTGISQGNHTAHALTGHIGLTYLP